MIIKCLVNTFNTSNTWLLEVGCNDWVIIDPGWTTHSLEEWIVQNKPRLLAVILTHEHADHCAGVNRLLKNQEIPLVCTAACKAGIGNSKQNFSDYLEELPVFEIHSPVVTVSDQQTLQLGAFDFTFHATPGHSPGSMCISTGNLVFTGDTLLYQTKTPLNFPHSSKQDYAKSMEKLKTYLHAGMRVYPGHGEPFVI